MRPEPTLQEKIQGFIHKRALFTKVDTVLVAVSGGPDSICLLHALHNLGYSLHCAHLNHGLRQESGEELKFVQDFCFKLHIPFTCEAANIEAEKAENGGSTQEAARRLRYDFLKRTADSVGAAVITTAHNRDDQVETVLLNIIRGSGLKGLGGIPVRRERIVRPMLDISRAEIESYCGEHQLNPCRDSSNESTKYSRNEVRLKLLPYLRERFNSQVDDAILRLSEIAKDDSDTLDSLALEWLDKRLPNPICKRELDGLTVGLQRRVLYHWLSNVCTVADVTFDHIENIRLNTKSSWNLPGNIRIELCKGCLMRSDLGVKSSLPLFEPIDVNIPSEFDFAGWNIKVSGEIPSDIQLAIRIAERGDRIGITSGHKKLSDVFSEDKTPIMERWGIPVLVDKVSKEVIAAPGIKRMSSLTPGLKLTAKRITSTQRSAAVDPE